MPLTKLYPPEKALLPLVLPPVLVCKPVVVVAGQDTLNTCMPNVPPVGLPIVKLYVPLHAGVKLYHTSFSAKGDVMVALVNELLLLVVLSVNEVGLPQKSLAGAMVCWLQVAVPLIDAVEVISVAAAMLAVILRSGVAVEGILAIRR